MQERQPSGAAVGWTMFAAFIMILIGSFHAIAGLAGILEDEFFAVTPTTCSSSTPRRGGGYT